MVRFSSKHAGILGDVQHRFQKISKDDAPFLSFFVGKGKCVSPFYFELPSVDVKSTTAKAYKP